MGILEKIKEIEAEMARTQKNKATEYHLGSLKAKLAKLRSELMEPASKSGAKSDGFDVARNGDARIALIGFPSVGKSTMLSKLTGTESEAAAYEFTTLTCIPGNIHYNGTKIQMLDLPGIIEGAARGKGRGRQVIACCKSADMVCMILDAGKEKQKNHREILEKELETVGIRLNTSPPNIAFVRKMTGGIKFTNTVPLTKLGPDPGKVVYNILHEYRIHNAEVLIREDVTVDQIIDVVEGNRKYMRCLYVYNKIDTISIEDVDRLSRLPNSMVISCQLELNFDRLLSKIWEYLAIVRVYTKRKGAPPDLSEPLILTPIRGGYSVKAACGQIHKDIIRDFNYGLVWGQSTKFDPQHCGMSHTLADEDVLQVLVKTNSQQKQDKDYSQRVQDYYTKQKQKKKKKGSK
eukprot:TRINITY_DN1617_c0_g2_i1.p1 TRINITY_DN1617_c0_g2~~TRINITY_DN1617_c0_g2_i1.p1  ORF type:complete len:405 (+),score=113.38 TRINITY_DN1617_c0_g2_i1:81-1295(+)